MKLSEKLLYLRKTKRLSQEQLASEIAVSRQAVSKWELGETLPDTDNAVQLAKALNVSIDFLLDDDIDLPAGTDGSMTPNPDKETEQDIIRSMLKDELKDKSDRLALRMRESRKKQQGREKWLMIALSLLVTAGVVIVYFLFFV